MKFGQNKPFLEKILDWVKNRVTNGMVTIAGAKVIVPEKLPKWEIQPISENRVIF